jgi:hypothetical protein
MKDDGVPTKIVQALDRCEILRCDHNSTICWWVVFFSPTQSPNLGMTIPLIFGDNINKSSLQDRMNGEIEG